MRDLNLRRKLAKSQILLEKELAKKDPNRLGKIDFVTVCYIKDLPQLIIQARSFKFLNNIPINKIFVVINGYFEYCQLYFDKYVRKEYGELDVVLVDGNKLIPTLKLCKGYHNQQKLKLLAAKLAETEDICILDAKNFFTRNWHPNDIWDEQGRIKISLTDTPYSSWETASEKSFTLFGLNYKNSPYHLLQQTPFFIKSTLLEELSTYPNLLDSWDAQYAEFLLINAFLVKKKITLSDMFFQNDEIINKTIWPHELTEDLELYDYLDNHRVISMGIHRKCFLMGTETFLNSLIYVWAKLGLSNRLESLEIVNQMKKFNLEFEDREIR